MWKNVGYSCALLMVGFLSKSDIRTKRISIKILLLSGGAALLFLVLSGKTDVCYMLQSIMPGIILLLLAGVTRESIGYGDGLVVALIGLFCGVFFTVVTVSMAFFLSSIYAVFLLWKRKEKTMPFLPFLLVAMEVFWLYE